MRRFSSDAAIPPAIRRTAAEWLALRDRGFTPGLETEFSRWLAADDRHATAFTEIDATWACLDRLEVMRPSQGPADPNLLFCDQSGRSTDSAQRTALRVRKYLLPVGLAAAAAVVVGLFTLRGPAIIPAETYAVRSETEIGASQKLDLPDGSVVHLNTNTAIHVTYRANERRLRLERGEAHFVVAKDARRPFVVGAGRIEVRAVGTAFNVRMDSAAVQVHVTEGKVRVADAVNRTGLIGARESAAREDKDDILGAGQRAVIAFPARTRSGVVFGPKVTVTSAPTSKASRTLAWLGQRLEFESTPLSEVVEEFNRYNRHKLVLADEQLHAMTFDGTFRIDGYDALVRLLESHFNISAERGESQTVLRLVR